MPKSLIDHIRAVATDAEAAEVKALGEAFDGEVDHIEVRIVCQPGEPAVFEQKVCSLTELCGLMNQAEMVPDLQTRVDLAERTLTGAGWAAVVGSDGRAWKPPLGNKPEWLRIEETQKVAAELQAKLNDVGERLMAVRRAAVEAWAERDRLLELNRQRGTACLTHDLVHGWACPACLQAVTDERDRLAADLQRLLNPVHTYVVPPLSQDQIDRLKATVTGPMTTIPPTPPADHGDEAAKNWEQLAVKYWNEREGFRADLSGANAEIAALRARVEAIKVNFKKQYEAQQQGAQL